MNRIFGLDIIRSTAILLVLISHLGMTGLFHNNYLLYLFGFYGVELFFVLSGFLIGGILIKTVEKGLTVNSVVNFWKNRWLRTLPLYYIVLLLHIIIEQPQYFPFSYFLFLQNTIHIYDKPIIDFNESWSLAVEEYFYLIFPVILYLLSKLLKKSVLLFILAIICMIVPSYLYKHNVFNTQYFDFEINFRKFTFLRLDAIAIGIFIAYIKHYFSKIFSVIQSKIIPLTSLLLIIGLNSYGNILVYDFYGVKSFPATIGAILNSFLLSLFIPFFVKLKNPGVLPAYLRIFIEKTAIYSYAMYLFHLPVYKLFIRHQTYSVWWFLEVLVSLCLVYLLSMLSFRFIEQPFLKFRKPV